MRPHRKRDATQAALTDDGKRHATKAAASEKRAASSCRGAVSVAAGASVKSRDGVLTCGACGAKSSDNVQWQFKRFDAKQNKEVPADDKCEPCWSRFVAGFVGYMSWPAYCEHVCSDDGRKQSEETSATLAGQPRSFFPQQVQDGVEWGVEQGRHYLILNTSEFTNHMQSRPHARMPKVPTMMVVKEDGSGELEKVFCFSHPTFPFRTAHVFARRRVATETLNMLPGQHVHSMQGESLAKLARSNMKNGLSMDAFLSAQAPDLDEYTAKFQDQKLRVAKPGDGAMAGDADGGPEGECDDDDVDNEDNLIGAHFAPPSLVGAPVAAPATTPKQARRWCLQARSSPAPVLIEEDGEEAGSPTPKQPASERSRPICADDSASCISKATDGGKRGGDIGKKARGSGSGSDYYIQHLDLPKIIMGEKLGVHLHHARLQLGKFSDGDPEKSRLHVHLLQVDRAFKLAPGVVQALSHQEILDILTQLRCPGDFPVPLSLQEHLVQAATRNAVQAVLANDMAAPWPHLFHVASPWGSLTTASGDFDAADPRLSDMEGNAESKIAIFSDIVYRDVFVSLLKDGQRSFQAVSTNLARLLDCLQQVVDSEFEDFPDGYIQCALTMAQITGAICALASDDLQEQSRRLEDLRRFHTSKGKTGKGWWVYMANEIGAISTYADKLENLLKQETTILEVSAFAEAQGEACDLGSGNLTEKAAKLAKICLDISRWEASAPTLAIAGLKDKMWTNLGDFVTEVEMEAQKNKMDATTAQELQASIIECSCTFSAEARLTGLIQLLGSMALSSRRSAAIEGLTSSCVALEVLSSDGKKDLDEEAFMARVATFKGHIFKCKGLVAEDDVAHKAVLGAIGACVQYYWRCKGPLTRRVSQDIALALGDFLRQGAPSDEAKVSLMAMKCHSELSIAMMQAGKNDELKLIDPKVCSDDEVQALMSATQAMKDAKGSERDHDYMRTAAETVAKAEAIIAFVADLRISAAQTAVKATHDALDAYLKPTRDASGKHWQETLATNCTWPAFALDASTRMEKVPPGGLVEKAAALQKAYDQVLQVKRRFLVDCAVDGDNLRSLLHEAKLVEYSGALSALLINPCANKVEQLRNVKRYVKLATESGVLQRFHKVLKAKAQAAVKV